MENDIDIINAYINQTLTATEKLAFEQRLQQDTTFKSLYEEHLVFLQGLERINLKAEIASAKKSYITRKWFGKGLAIALPITTVLVIATLFFYNKTTVKDELRALLNFEMELIQKFEVSNDSIIEIKGKKGTQLTINRDDLEFESGKDLTDEQLSIELLELTNRQDLLLANAQTKSNGKWLISGGAFKIDIKANGKPLRLKDDKTLSARFPKNTQKEQMQLFYGNRNENDYLNWELTDIELKNEKQFVIFCEDTLLLDVVMTRRYAGVETYRAFLKIDTLGYLASDDIFRKFPEIKNIQNQKDTLYVCKEYIMTESLPNQDAELDTKYSQFNRLSFNKYVDSIYGNSGLTFYDSKRTNDNFEKQNAFYESIQLSKLGWINIDQFAKYEDLVTLTLENDLGFDFNIYLDEAYTEYTKWHETYLIDEENNTVLNVYSSQLDIPKNKEFTIISCVIVDDTFYVCRKAIKVSENSKVTLDYKKRSKSQIKSILRL